MARPKKPVYKSTLSLGTTAPAGKTITIDTKQLEVVRKSVFIEPILKAVASDVVALEFTMDGDDTQKQLFENYLEKNFVTSMLEMIVWAWVYGECFAEADVSMKLINGVPYYYPKAFIPFDMSKAKKDEAKQIVKYNDKEISYTRLMRLTLFTQAGQPYPNGMDYYNLVSGLELSLKSWVHAGCSNAVGTMIQTVDPNTTLQREQYEDLMKFNEAFSNHIGMAMTMPPGVNCQILASPGVSGEFEKMIGYNLFLFMSGLRSQWTMASITSPGTYGTVETQKASYYDYVHFLGTLVDETLTKMAEKVCVIWNLEPSTITFTHRKPNVADFNYEFANALKTVLELSPYLSQSQKEYLYNLTGLPLPELGQKFPITTAYVQEIPQAPIPTTPVAQNSYIQERLQSKKNYVKTLFLARVKEMLDGGNRRNLEITGHETLCKDLGVNNIDEVKTYLNSLSTELNTALATVKENPTANYETVFDGIWKKLENEVQKWTQRKSLTTGVTPNALG